MRSGLRSQLLCSVLILAAASIWPAWGQEFPSRAITLTVPYGIGGGVDASSRLLAKRISSAFGQPVVVKSVMGGAGVIGHRSVRAAAPDGYNLLVSSNVHFQLTHISNAPDIPDVLTDFDPVAPIGDQDSVLLVSSSVPAKSLDELIKLAREKPGSLSYGGVTAAMTYLLGYMIAQKDMVFVPYKSSAGVISDLISGRVSAAWESIGVVPGAVASGRVRAIVQTSKTRSPPIPDVPTVLEAGHPELQLSFSYFIVAPKGTPRPIIEKLNAAITEATRLPDVREAYAKIDFKGVTASPAELSQMMKAEDARWAKIIDETGTHEK
jgi:tripartite-type tricarboxylate transporter receptor subunit TctC